MLRKIFFLLLIKIYKKQFHDDQKKIGFIYIGPPGDHGWTYMHDQGRIYMEKKLWRLNFNYLYRKCSENADAVRAIRKLAESGHDLIFHNIFQLYGSNFRGS